MTDERLVIGDFEYEKGDDGQWYELESAGGESYWVGPPLDDPQLSAALDEIERLRADLAGWNGTMKLHSEVDVDRWPDITSGVNDDR